MQLPHTDKLNAMLVILCIASAATAWNIKRPDLQGDETLVRKMNSLPADDETTLLAYRSDPIKAAIDNFGEILDRPLFNPSRRPTVIASVDALDKLLPSRAARTDSAAFTLVGIIIVGESRFALIRTRGAAATQRVNVGDELDGWRVTALTPDTATLSRGSQSTTIELERKANPTTAARIKALAKKRRRQAKGRGAARDAPVAVRTDSVNTVSDNNDDKDDRDEDQDEDDE